MDLGLSEKVFLVTGGASGIGEAITNTLLREGAKVAVIDKNQNAIEQLNRKLVTGLDNILFLNKSINKAEDCKEVVEKSVSSFGQIDGLVNNAGINDSVGLEHGDPEAYLSSLEKNLHHYFYMAHYALSALKKSRGSILNISSKTAITGQGGTSAYAGAKGAQLAFTREWAVELLPYQIRVNAIVPAEVWTPLYKNWVEKFPDPESKLKAITEKIPFENRMTSPDEIANMAVFLLSEKASHVTGQHIFVDGGYVHLDRSLAGL